MLLQLLGFGGGASARIDKQYIQFTQTSEVTGGIFCAIYFCVTVNASVCGLPETEDVQFSSLILCLILAGSACAQDKVPVEKFDLDTQPQVAALMPPAQQAFGLDLRVFDAGNAPLKVESPFIIGSGFSFGLRVLAHRGENWSERVKLLSVVGADGSVLEHTSSYGTHISQPSAYTPFAGFFWNSQGVDPHWPYLTANVEVAAAGISEEQKGARKTPFHIRLPLPTEGEVAVDIPVTTPEGTQIRFTRVANVATGFSTTWNVDFSVEKKPQVEAFDLGLEATSLVSSGGEKAKEQKFESRGRLLTRDTGRLYISGPPGATSLDWMGVLVELSPAWRSRSKFKTLSFRIPVEQVVRVTKLVPSTTTRLVGAGAKVEPEALERLDNGFEAGFWLSPVSSPEKLRQQSQLLLNMGGADARVEAIRWHLDGRPATTDETYVTVSSRNGVLEQSTLKLEGQLKTQTVHKSSNVFHDIPLPAVGQVKEFEEGDFQTDQFTLRKVAFIEDGALWKLKYGVNLEKGPALAFVFQLRSVQVGNSSQGELKGVFDERGVAFNERAAFYGNKDFTDGEPLDGKICVIYLPFDYAASKKMNLSLDWREFGEEKTMPFAAQLPVDQFKSKS